MIFNTSSFGYVEIDDSEVINFPEGIYAFESVKEFAILKQNDDEESPIMWLQAIKDEHLSFVILTPSLFIEDYLPTIPKDVLKKLQVENMEVLHYFVIAIVPKDIKDMTVNLKSPIVINTSKNIAMQVILENNDYSIRHKVFDQNRKVDENANY